MELLKLLAARAESAKPLRVGLIGAGKFGTMFLSQARQVTGLHVLGVADLAFEHARSALHRAGFPDEQITDSFDIAQKRGATCITTDAAELIRADGLEVVIECTGLPAVGIRHALLAIEQRCHVVMVNVEADVLAGPLLARRAQDAGVVYSQAYGDQPALICEMVEWARACGLPVVCAGKGTKYLPVYHTSTPATVWEHYGFSQEQIASGELNAQMFNSFLDGTKSAIEMAAVANATGLEPQPDGLHFPPCGTDDLPRVLRPLTEGGLLAHKGTVEVVSSLERDGRPVYRDLRWGMFVVFEAPSDYVRRCFAEYGLITDPSGRYAALYRPAHLVGLELNISVLRAGLRGEATGTSSDFRGDVVAVAKRALTAGQVLDGEGGYCVYGKLMPARASLDAQALPIGLAHQLKLKHPIAAGQVLRWSDVEYDPADPTIRFRQEMEGLAYR